MGFVKEFREFAVRGNVVDMAVGIIIGAAFGKIVSSMVSDVIMPPIGMVIGGVDFTGLQVTLKEAAETAPAVTLKYGAFLQQVFDFTIVAFAMFLLIKGINKLKKKDEAVAPAPTNQEVLLTEIRDIINSKG
jgi:large conductance mechanosensitive channel